MRGNEETRPCALIRWTGTHLSSVSSSSWFRSQAIYSSEASVMRGHQDRSRARSFCRFSAISSTPSSVSLLQPERLSTVRCGRECTVIGGEKRAEFGISFGVSAGTPSAHVAACRCSTLQWARPRKWVLWSSNISMLPYWSVELAPPRLNRNLSFT